MPDVNDEHFIKVTVEIVYPFRPEDYKEYNGYNQYVQLCSTPEQAATHDFEQFSNNPDDFQEFLAAAVEEDFDGDYSMTVQTVSYNDEGDETVHHTVHHPFDGEEPS